VGETDTLDPFVLPEEFLNGRTALKPHIPESKRALAYAVFKQRVALAVYVKAQVARLPYRTGKRICIAVGEKDRDILTATQPHRTHTLQLLCKVRIQQRHNLLATWHQTHSATLIPMV